jgi:hypothetical protein
VSASFVSPSNSKAPPPTAGAALGSINRPPHIYLNIVSPPEILKLAGRFDVELLTTPGLD